MNQIVTNAGDVYFLPWKLRKVLLVVAILFAFVALLIFFNEITIKHQASQLLDGLGWLALSVVFGYGSRL